GKPKGVIAAVKEFQQVAGPRHIVYVDIGKGKGIQPGGYVRIFRTAAGASLDMVQQGTRKYETKIMGVPIGRKLTKTEINTLPRTVLGEMMILSSEEESAVGIVTYSWEDIYPGDEVEIE